MEDHNKKMISLYVHEEIMAKMERQSKRLFILCIIIFSALILTNAGWIYYENQFEDITMTQEATSDGNGDATINGSALGDVNYYGEGETNN